MDKRIILLQNYTVLLFCTALLCLAPMDHGPIGTPLFALSIACLIFIELFMIRMELAKIFADVLTNNPLLNTLLKSSVLNAVIALVFALFLSAQMMITLNLADNTEIVLFIIMGCLLVHLSTPISQLTGAVLHRKPSMVVARIIAISLAVSITVIIDGLITINLPIDDRITAPFDIDIPLYVTADINHSSTYFQHIQRTILYIDFNIQSLALSAKLGDWFTAIWFFLLLNPAPYIAFTLLFFSIKFALQRFIFTGAPGLDSIPGNTTEKQADHACACTCHIATERL